jgi:DNA polymerase III delta subunit
VFYGGEDYYLDQAFEQGKRWPKRQVTILDGDSLEEAELVGELEAQSFDGRDRAVVLDNAHKHGKKGGPLSSYIEAKEVGDDRMVLVAIVRSERLSPIWAAAAKKGRVKEHKSFKPWEGEKQSARIKREAKKLGLELADGLPQQLTAALGDDLRLVMNELRKLVYIVGEGGKVELKHAASVVAHMYPAEPYDVAKAAVEKRAGRAMSLLSFLYKHLGEGAWVPVTISLQRLVEKLIVARQLLDSDTPTLVLARSVGVTAKKDSAAEFVFRKNWLGLVQKHTVRELLRHMQKLCELETQVKGPARSKRTLVELAILSIAA